MDEGMDMAAVWMPDSEYLRLIAQDPRAVALLPLAPRVEWTIAVDRNARIVTIGAHVLPGSRTIYWVRYSFEALPNHLLNEADLQRIEGNAPNYLFGEQALAGLSELVALWPDDPREIAGYNPDSPEAEAFHRRVIVARAA